MAINYFYPHVSINKNILERRRNVQEYADTTVMFVPFIAKKGPNNQIVKIHSLDEFISVYGELDYAYQGQTALNIMNWLTSGNGNAAANGTILAYRITKNSETADAKTNPASGTPAAISGLSAKYPGTYYNDITMEIETATDLKSAKSIVIKKGNTVVERYYNVAADSVSTVLRSSDFVEVESVNSLITGTTTKTFITDSGTSRRIQFLGGSDETSQENTIKNFWTITNNSSPADILQSSLETPVDVIMDAGYDVEIKTKMVEYLMTYRPDIILFLDEYKLGFTSNQYESTTPTPTSLSTVFAYTDETKKELYNKFKTNIAVYQQYFTINENTLFEDERSIYVTPSYFIARLLPYNDAVHGVQYPMAGLRRGVLSGATSVNINPKPTQKDSWFATRYNYVEKSSREYAFMSQRTFDNSTAERYTALSFLNNSRALQKIVKQIEAISREYLFEYNDAITLSQLKAELSKYINNWLANRTLDKAEVDVRKNELSNEAVDVTIVIRFTDTIEVITVDLTVE